MARTENHSFPIAVCAAIIVRQGQVLITRRPEGKRLGGFWEFPGGKIDTGESPHAALIRELKEELDISVSVDQIFETVYHRYDWGAALILAYLCHWDSGTIKHLEVADHQWVRPENFSDYNILPADQPILDKLRAALN
ncbi:MAG: (deoxy)nucleoside triphosphate pyrophosphohydrolase [Desulfuromonadales bacterium]|nr:(deoxy)nucleoside triphosphate pyrophosphohydrolase [Desulfuromonadales bacterium]MBN2792040.1 (deoxy)nucleoside triphosphate pyrophosphohydrolase [Desulfuromonadales bacterium]